MADRIYRRFYRMNAIVLTSINDLQVIEFVRKFTKVTCAESIIYLDDTTGLHLETKHGEYNLWTGDYLVWLGEGKGFSVISNGEFIALWNEFRKEIRG